jgi:hypothetical protein
MPQINSSHSNKTMPTDTSTTVHNRFNLAPPGFNTDKKNREGSYHGSTNTSKTRIIISNTVPRESNKEATIQPAVIITKVEKH